MLNLNVVTPERAFLNENCLSVSLPAKLGEMQVLSGHASCLVELKAGLVVYENKDHKPVRFMIAQGFAEVDKDKVNILCELARNKQELDQSQEQSRSLELENQIAKLVDDEESQKRLRTELEKSLASLKLFE